MRLDERISIYDLDKVVVDKNKVNSIQAKKIEEGSQGIPTMELSINKLDYIRHDTQEELLKTIFGFKNEIDIKGECDEEMLYMNIVLHSNKIAIDNKRGGANLVLTNHRTFYALQDHCIPVMLMFNGRVDMELNSTIPDGFVMVMYVGNSEYDRPIFYYENDKGEPQWCYIPERGEKDIRILNFTELVDESHKEIPA